jgi:hypothetical protein
MGKSSRTLLAPVAAVNAMTPLRQPSGGDGDLVWEGE